jgi:osmotically-inducible protein OsmY
MKQPQPGGAGQIRRLLAPLNISELRVELMEGWVHLHGVTRSYAEKRLAGELAAEAAGGPVANELRIAHKAFGEDERLLQDIARELARLPQDATADVTVDVCEGVAELHGSALDESQRQAIHRAVRNAGNVVRLDDHLTLAAETIADDDVARALSEYVHRATRVPHGSVTVKFVQGVAWLDGRVPTEVQRHAIEDLIRWHNGVQEVRNGLLVGPVTGGRASAGNRP